VRYFPLFLDTQNRSVLVAGGGEQAAQKVRLLLKSQAHITVMAPSLSDELASYLQKNLISHANTVYDENLAQKADFVFAATPCAGINGIFIHAASNAQTINVVDKPSLSNSIMPALVDRDPVVVAIGTEGTSPVIARYIKNNLEHALEHSLGDFALLCAEFRKKVSSSIPDELKRHFWEWVVFSSPFQLWKQKRYLKARQLIQNTLKTFASSFPKNTPFVSIISACKQPDMLSVRAVQRMQNADIILHSPDIPPSFFEFARRDALRTPVSALPLNDISALPSSTRNIVFLTTAPSKTLSPLAEKLAQHNRNTEIIPCSCHPSISQHIANG
jgi:uroporphyrin-III C-methyltransferase/precorrin-2 dehydrogenase/sirohydrochlorin ferrochelatase